MSRLTPEREAEIRHYVVTEEASWNNCAEVLAELHEVRRERDDLLAERARWHEARDNAERYYHQMTAQCAAVEKERDELKARLLDAETLASVGTWHKDCRPNREQAAREIQKMQAVINKLADTNAELRKDLALAVQAREGLVWKPIDTTMKDRSYYLVALIRHGVVWRVSEAAFNGLCWYNKGGQACHWRTHYCEIPKVADTPAEKVETK